MDKKKKEIRPHRTDAHGRPELTDERGELLSPPEAGKGDMDEPVLGYN